jgi:spoIIIJ-associated protein
MEFTGKSVEEAILTGLKELNLNREDAKITVIEEAVKGIFGIVKKPAKVDIESALTGGKRAVNFLNGYFEKTSINAKATLVEEGEKIVIDLVAENSAVLIGYRGEILDSLQTLASAIANIDKKEYIRVVVNCEGYREKREETLISLAHKLADKAVRLGRDVTLEPMNPYERRIIHSALANSDKVKTTSEGKEPNRFVVITPNEKKPQSDRPRRDNRGNKGGRRDNRDRGFKKDNADAPKRVKPSAFGTFLGNSKDL